MKDFIRSKKFLIPAAAVCVLAVLVLVFAAGVFIGLEKARFSYSWGENYFRNFAGRGRFVSDHDYINAHGLDGQIIKIDGNTLTIKNHNGVEGNVLVDSQTAIRNFKTQITINDLKINEYVAVIGSPNSQGQIQAKLIRVLPNAMQQMPAMPSMMRMPSRNMIPVRPTPGNI